MSNENVFSENIIITIIRIIPKQGCEEEVLKWFDSIAETASKFEGHLKSEVFESPKKSLQKEMLNIFRFDTYKHLMEWENSGERKVKLKEGEKLFAEIKERSQLTGLEFWFEGKSTPANKLPAKWKMALITIITIFILLNSLLIFCQQLFIVINFSPLVRSLLSVIILVITMTYLIMPLLTRLFSRWLFGRNIVK